jgi:uncharacterized repeat protein (TIGR03803 family)
MKMSIKDLFVVPVLIAGLGVIPAGSVTAQTFTTLYSFTGGNDGANPFAGLILSGNSLYGTAGDGGSGHAGTVFGINTNGSNFTILCTFTNNINGWNPWDGLILAGNTLYGTTAGDIYGAMPGTIFEVSTDGTGFTNLYTFTRTSGVSPAINSDGACPYAGLVLSGNTLYGTARNGGGYGAGTVFALNTNGTAFAILHTFSYTDGYGPIATMNRMVLTALKAETSPVMERS